MNMQKMIDGWNEDAKWMAEIIKASESVEVLAALKAHRDAGKSFMFDSMDPEMEKHFRVLENLVNHYSKAGGHSGASWAYCVRYAIELALETK